MDVYTKFILVKYLKKIDYYQLYTYNTINYVVLIFNLSLLPILH